MFNKAGMNGSPRAQPRYDPNGTFNRQYRMWRGSSTSPRGTTPATYLPGFRIGLPLVKDKVFLFGAFSPEWSNEERTITYNPAFATFAGDIFPGQPARYRSVRTPRPTTSTCGWMRRLGPEVHVFGSVLDQGQHQSGEKLPNGDDVHGLYNPSDQRQPDRLRALSWAMPHPTRPITSAWITQLAEDRLHQPLRILLCELSRFRLSHNRKYLQLFGRGVGAEHETTGAAQCSPPICKSRMATSTSPTARPTHLRRGQAHPVRPGRRLLQERLDGYAQYQARLPADEIQQQYLPALARAEIEVFPGSTEVYSPAGSTGAANCAALTAILWRLQRQYGYVIISGLWHQGTGHQLRPCLFRTGFVDHRQGPDHQLRPAG